MEHTKYLEHFFYICINTKPYSMHFICKRSSPPFNAYIWFPSMPVFCLSYTHNKYLWNVKRYRNLTSNLQLICWDIHSSMLWLTVAMVPNFFNFCYARISSLTLSTSKHGAGPLVVPFGSCRSRNLFNGLPWFLKMKTKRKFAVL